MSINDFGISADASTSVFTAISSVGHWVVWDSAATNLAFPDLNGFGDVFVRGPYGP